MEVEVVFEVIEMGQVVVKLTEIDGKYDGIGI